MNNIAKTNKTSAAASLESGYSSLVSATTITIMDVSDTMSFGFGNMNPSDDTSFHWLLA